MEDSAYRQLLKWKNRARELERLNAQLRETIEANEQAMEEIGQNLETFQAEHDQALERIQHFETRTPTEDQKRIAELETQLAGFHRENEARPFLDGKLANGVTLAKFFQEAGYTPGADALTEEVLAELMGKVKTAAPYLLKEAPADAGGAADAAKANQGPTGQQGAAAPARPTVGMGGGIGAPDRAGRRVTYTKSDVQAPGWNNKRPDLVEALREGTAILVE